MAERAPARHFSPCTTQRIVNKRCTSNFCSSTNRDPPLLSSITSTFGHIAAPTGKMESNQPSKTSGYMKEATGTVKENVGWALGNEQMQAEGLKTKKEGEAEVKAAQTQQYTKGMGEDIKGNVKEGWGKMTGDESMKAEGKAEQTQGKVRKDFNS